MIHKFSVSEARTAILCPRIFYFDQIRHQSKPGTKRLTHIWTGDKKYKAATACGSLFHSTVEKFNQQARQAPEIHAALESAAQSKHSSARNESLFEAFKRFAVKACVNRAILNNKPAAQSVAFGEVLDRYFRELAEVLGYAVTHGRETKQLLEEFFNEMTKRVDVTFRVGPGSEYVNIRGILDYIFFDYRVESHRIIDFKLTPPSGHSSDTLQVSLYTLMYEKQHDHRTSASVLYLYPVREMATVSWEDVEARRPRIFDLLASMAAWSQYDETSKQGLKPPGEPGMCSACPWNKNGQCEMRLGSKFDGNHLHHWADAAARNQFVEPPGERRQPATEPDPIEYDEIDDDSNDPDVDAASEVKFDSATVTAPRASQANTDMYVGSTIDGGIPVTIPVSSLKTHVAVMGAAGSGKSWLAKVVAEEAILQRVPVLAIDPQGDLVQFLHGAQLPETASANDRQRQEEFRRRAEVRIWTPGSSHGIRLRLAPLRLPTHGQLQGMDSEDLRDEQWRDMLGVAAGNLVTLAAAGGSEEMQKTFIFKLLEQLVGKGSQSRDLGVDEILSAVAAPEDFGIDADSMISKREREKVRQLLYARFHGPSSNLFSGGLPLDLDRFTQPLEPGKVPLNVIYLNAMADDSQKQYFVAALAAEVYRWMITSAATPGAVRLLTFLDEARDYLPAGTIKPPAKGPLLRLFAQGRKFGVSCLICTQSPRSVDYQAFSNASTKLIGRLEATQDVTRVGEWFTDGGGAPMWLAGRNGASDKTFVGRWPDIGADLDGEPFRSRPLYSLHEGAWSPERVATEWSQSPIRSRLNASSPS